MNRIFRISAVIVLVWAAVFHFGRLCSAWADDAPDLKPAAKTFVQQLAEGQFEKAASTFDDTMKKAMPAATLKLTWQRVVAGAGPLKKQFPPRQSVLLDYQIVIVPCTFEKTTLNVRVVFDKKQRITGLFFLAPENKNPDSKPSSKPRDDAHAITLKGKGGTLYGTIDFPKGDGPFPVALILAGSGPTDRDGNQAALKNDSLKQLGAALSAQKIAAVRYDKRLIGQSVFPGVKEQDVRFDVYIEDAVTWIKKLRQDRRFSRVFVVGHSEGSLIGMVAARRAKADAFVSLAGAGRSAPVLLREQLGKNLSAELQSKSDKIIDELIAGRTRDDFDPALAMLFRRSVQPYLISWFKYDPAKELARLNIPILIVQGTTDIQVTLTDAKTLARANTSAELFLAEGVNHVLKPAQTKEDQTKTYTDPTIPISPQVTERVIEFLNDLLTK